MATGGWCNRYIQYTAQIERVAFTCSGLKSYVTLLDYFQPFQIELWISLTIQIVMTSILFGIIFYFKGIRDVVWFYQCSFLTEHSFYITSTLEKLRIFNFFSLPFLLMCVILSNAYKGLLINLLGLPLAERFGIAGQRGAPKSVYFKPSNIFTSVQYQECCMDP